MSGEKSITPEEKLRERIQCKESQGLGSMSPSEENWEVKFAKRPQNQKHGFTVDLKFMTILIKSSL
jgi:hypothetical protein